MAWRILIVAGIFEIVWAVGLKYSEGFTRLWPSVGTVAAMLVSFSLLSVAMRELPVGTAYTVWTGIGAAGTAIWGIAMMGESREPLRLACLALVVIGIAGLKVLAEPAG